MKDRPLTENMRKLLWTMLGWQANPSTAIPIIDDERTADALVRRGILSKESGGYRLDGKAARRALARP